jgi:DNA-binding NarL/FixJ family response regulator
VKRPRVLLADDHRLVAEGLKSLLTPDFELVGLVEDGRALVAEAKRLRPDVIVADITMPRLNGLEALALLKADNPAVKVVIITMHRESAYARRAISAGASGFVLKHSAPTELVAAIRAALNGKTFIAPEIAGELERRGRAAGPAADPVAALTTRQREILQLLALGKTAKEVAVVLGVSARTVEFHKYKMMEAVGAATSAELIRFAIQHGIATV